MNSGDHFGSYGDPPSSSERATKRAIENLRTECNRIRQLETELADARVEAIRLAEALAEKENLLADTLAELAAERSKINES